MKGDAPVPKGKRKPLFAGPSRLIGKTLSRRSRFGGYRAPAPDIVCQNACDGFEVHVEAAHHAAVRTFATSARTATSRAELLAAWAQVPPALRSLLQQAFDLAERELRWPRPPEEVPPEPILYVRATTSAIDRFLGPES